MAKSYQRNLNFSRIKRVDIRMHNAIAASSSEPTRNVRLAGPPQYPQASSPKCKV